MYSLEWNNDSRQSSLHSIPNSTWLDSWLGFILRKQTIRTESKLQNERHFVLTGQSHIFLMALGFGYHKTLVKSYPSVEYPTCNSYLASIGTSYFDPRHVREMRLLSEVLQ